MTRPLPPFSDRFFVTYLAVAAIVSTAVGIWVR